MIRQGSWFEKSNDNERNSQVYVLVVYDVKQEICHKLNIATSTAVD